MKAERVQSHETSLGSEKKSNLRQRLLKKTPNLSRLGNRSLYERGEITSANDSLSFLVDFYRSEGTNARTDHQFPRRNCASV